MKLNQRILLGVPQASAQIGSSEYPQIKGLISLCRGRLELLQCRNKRTSKRVVIFFCVPIVTVIPVQAMSRIPLPMQEVILVTESELARFI